MKVVFSSTIEQEQEICDLVTEFYDSVFPRYFSDKEIRHLAELGVLQTPSKNFSYFGTLKEAYQVMTSIQVIMSILETKDLQSYRINPKNEELFLHNARLLNDYGLFFPLNLEHFTVLQEERADKSFYLYTEAANQLLI
ncbi:hypothetical protein CVD28_24990 [Bacillus sp. M6-12]|uniref:DUF5365 family protein n=1 Tax=Bacillus sp. M6-12 TaxID=2054166 RepID=UPI000C786BAD|nr:DUF5365 family protein [Bacillus sp. M6-12]PLS14981.1 hypothetical protein CVD28_24990 [Bacillus sp. M6-12]